MPEKNDSLINDYDFDVPYQDLMSRHCSFADCVITRLDDTVLKDITISPWSGKINGVNLFYTGIAGDVQGLCALHSSF